MSRVLIKISRNYKELHNLVDNIIASHNHSLLFDVLMLEYNY